MIEIEYNKLIDLLLKFDAELSRMEFRATVDVISISHDRNYYFFEKSIQNWIFISYNFDGNVRSIEKIITICDVSLLSLLTVLTIELNLCI